MGPARSSESSNLTEAAEEPGSDGGEPTQQGVRHLGDGRRADLSRIARGISSPRTAAGARRKARTCTTTSTPAIRRSGSYAPDLSRRAYSDRLFENASARLTWQITGRSKIGVFWDEQALCRTCTGATSAGIDPPRASPEAVGVFGRPLRVMQATWSAPLSSRLLVEAGFGGTYFGFGNFERRPNPTRDLIRVVEQCANGCAANGNIPGLAYRSQDFSTAYNGSYLWKGSVSYITGSHSLKAGYQHTLMSQDVAWVTNNQNLTYRLDNGVPNQLTESISPWVNKSRAGWDAVFAQERWTRGRLTLEGAARFDRASSWFPVQQEGPSRFLPTPIVVPETRGVDSYKDVTPRMGAAYDVLGNGRTALKVHLGRYLDGAGTSGIYLNTNPTMRMPQTTPSTSTAGVTRTWVDANGNFVPDCDLLNPNAQDLRASGGDLCGVVSNTSFGQNVLTNNFDPGILNGWGVRPSDWTLDVSVQQQILPRASVTVAYSRRWYHGFTVADNLALQPSDLTPFSVVAPVDPRLPGGGGYAVSGSVRRRSREIGPGEQFHRRLEQVRSLVSALQRRRRHDQPADHRWLDVAGRDEHRVRRWRTTATCARTCRSFQPQ